jgi:hypothetical protein
LIRRSAVSGKITDVTILLDRSGSMKSIREATVAGINKFIDEMNRVPGEGIWSLAQFDDPDSARGARESFPHIVFQDRADSEVPRFEVADFMPRGRTALIDAVCFTVQKLSARILPLPEADRPRVMVVIMTDGLENASREFSSARMRELIAEAQGVHGWEFIYLGANQDAFAEAGKFGIDTRVRDGVSNKIDYTADSQGVGEAFQACGKNARRWKLDGNDTAEELMGSSAPDDPSKTT